MSYGLFYRPSQRSLFMCLQGVVTVRDDRDPCQGLHMASSTMLVQTALEILGLDPTASLHHIKTAYRTLAKKCHPNENSRDGSTVLFQQLNFAYQTLASYHIAEPSGQEDCSHAGPVCVESIFDSALHTKQNTFSITIDITDIMFLVIFGECETP